MDLSHQRKEYGQDSLDIESLDECPFRQFQNWFQDASSGSILEPNAMTLSTVAENGQPTQRTVLLKYFDTSGFVFFTNYHSRKAKHIAANSNVSILFPWLGQQRQVEINGRAEKVSTAESLKYFALRPRGSQLGAWVSHQSSVVSARSLLHNKFLELTKKFASGDVPKPPSWGGFRVHANHFEFWQGGPNRLHDRIEYVVAETGSKWLRQRLAP